MAADVLFAAYERLHPDDPKVIFLRLRLAQLREDPVRLIDAISDQLALTPARPDLRLARARACFTSGRLDDGIKSIREMRLPPDHPQRWQVALWHSKLLVRAYRFAEAREVIATLSTDPITAVIADLQSTEILLLEGDTEAARHRLDRILEREGLPPRLEFEAAFHLARACDRLGDFDAAFDAAARGNAIHPHDFDADAWDRSADEIIERWDREALASEPRSTVVNETPVFVVGLPRSGTSLLEQIIASHPRGGGVGERQDPFILSENLEFLEQQRPGGLPTLEDLDHQAALYQTMPERVGVRRDRIVNKALGLERVLGRMAGLLPGARVIRIDRDPRDTILSIHQHSLNLKKYPWSSRLTDLVRAHATFSRLMDHWESTLPIPMLSVRYEALIDDPETQINRITTFLGLESDAACLRFHEQKRAVLTPSHDQVNRPLNRKGIGRWRSYQARIEPVLKAYPNEDHDQ
ncbi:MAG: hypothetical protein CMJ23_08385 [Phycisphaerae bacterium]|nr:hypothetical protein [Phycisphaerae bacterium]